MNHPDMADIDDKYKTKKSETEPIKKYRRRNAFKKNVPKKLRKEWGERMNFLRSL
jgi:hypothetical protein